MNNENEGRVKTRPSFFYIQQKKKQPGTISRVLWSEKQTACHLSRLAVTDKFYRPTLQR